jgi:hypothetical protein
MDWFEYVRQNIWLGVIVASVLTSLAVAFINLTERGRRVDNTTLGVVIALIFSVVVTNFDLDWGKFVSYQDTVIRLSLTLLIPYLAAKTRGQEIVDSIIQKTVDGAKGMSIGKKE